MTVDINSTEFNMAVNERIREVLRNELNEYIQNGSILPIKIQGSNLDGQEAANGDTLKYNATLEIMEVAP